MVSRNEIGLAPHCGIGRFFPAVTAVGLAASLLIAGACAAPDEAPSEPVANEATEEKIEPPLRIQVDLRRQQIASPSADRLDRMRSQGMKLDDIAIQLIYIYLSEEMSAAQVNELEAMGIVLYLDSWLPPVGSHPTGFLLANIPVGTLETLAAKPYVVKLDTAEEALQPQ